MTSTLVNGNCLEEMKKLPDKSVDLLICDLPYGETNCKWDNKIDLVEFWTQFKRIRKSKRTACIHFCSTKFGYTLIKSWEKGFKMDMVWKKRNKTGGLSSRYRPMRNHEMVYFFYEQVPKYNRDKYHKRINNQKIAKTETSAGTKSDNFDNENKVRKQKNFNPVQPASVVEEKPKKKRNIRDSTRANEKKDIFGYNQDAAKPHQYEPPNPASIVEEKESRYHKDYEKNGKRGMNKDEMYSKKCIKEFQEKNGIGFNPPNPSSVLEEKEFCYGTNNGYYKDSMTKRPIGKNVFEPPNPASVVEEKPHINIYGLDKSHPTWDGSAKFVPPNPSSILEEKSGGDIYGEKKIDQVNRRKEMYKKSGNVNNFEPPNPASILEDDLWGEEKKARHQRYLECGCGYFEPRQPDSVFESEKVFIGKRHHQTEKPQDILEFFLKYWSDAGDVILDPTMGSGSTGVACKKLERNFIGFELDETIFKVAEKRINN